MSPERRMAPVEEQLEALLRGTDFGDAATERTMRNELRERLEEDRPLRVYCGYDPTSVDLTLGHTLSMRKLRQFQEFGHQVTFLIGNFTGLIGDPTDKNKTRPMLTAAQLAENARTYAEQAFRILDGERTTVRYNADWLGKLTFGEVIQIASNYTVAQFLERESFAKRYAAHEPIHLSEFLYAIMQARDAVELETDVQVGGRDQLFNLMAGRPLQREYGQKPQVIITLPLLVGTDGHEKMSKSLGNYIAMTDTARDIFGKVMSLPDETMRDYYVLLTSMPLGEVDGLLAGPPMEAKKRLAREIAATLHGAEAALEAQAYFESTIQRRETPAEMQTYALGGEPEAGRLDRVLRDAGLAKSAAEARRLVEQGGVLVNGERATDFARQLTPGDELKVGRHRFLRVVAG
ncbi:MAG: tyrosine--tRNA ligase [Dehalococcoidia bacterium]|nr:tyrosine--tRNA ligase [Dehalococcoidia bacterium]